MTRSLREGAARGLGWLLKKVSPPAAAAPLGPAALPPAHPLGHFYSPFPSLADIEAREAAHFGRDEPLAGVDLNEAGQLALLGELMPYYAELPWGETGDAQLRYGFENGMYSYADAIFLYCMLRRFRPRRVVEIGSGHSSCVTLDTNDLFFGGAIECTFIEPYPSALLSLLRPEDRARVRLLEQKVQDVPLAVFDELQPDDVLFVDSGHVSKVGSDLNHVVFDVLPRLASGVLVHFHDVYYPFEYPGFVLRQGIAWNEAYLLQYNEAFEILLFSTFLETTHPEQVFGAMPLCRRNNGGSLLAAAPLR